MLFLCFILLLLKTLFLFIRLKLFSSKRKKAILIFNYMQTSGPFFVKLGQVLSLRSDIVGKETAFALQKLQDRLKPFPGKIAKQKIIQEFSQPIEEIFSTFQEEAIAAASIAQVHKATTLEGKEVAVKVLRPNIEKKFQYSLKILYALAKIINFFPSYKRLKALEVLDIFSDIMKKELDMRFEAASFSEIKENSFNDEGVCIPYVDWKRTSKNILTLEWVDAIPIYNKEEILKAGCDTNIICYNLIKMFLNHAFRDGFFHADLHPGNIFVNTKNEIILVDFGITGRLDKRTKLYIIRIFKGFFLRNYKYVADVHFEAGYVPKDQSRENFMLACRAIGEPIFGVDTKNISVANLLELLFKITKDFNMETQPQLLLLQKTMILVEGLISNLSPDMNLWKEIQPWFEEWANANISIQKQIKYSSTEFVRVVKNIPNLFDKLEELVDIQTNINNKEKTLQHYKKTLNRFFYVTIMFFLLIILFFSYSFI